MFSVPNRLWNTLTIGWTDCILNFLGIRVIDAAVNYAFPTARKIDLLTEGEFRLRNVVVYHELITC